MRSYQRAIPIWALALILFLVPISPGHGEETYFPEEILQAPWGNEPGQFGLIEEAEGVGPQSLCLDPEGNIYVLDLVNCWVQVFTPQGDLLRHMAFEILAHDLCLNQQEELYLLAPYDGLVEKLDHQGHPLALWSISPRIQLIDGIRAIENKVLLRTAAQEEHLLADAKGVLSPERQLETLQLGMGGPHPGMRYKTQWINHHVGMLQYLDAGGQKLQEARITTQQMLGSLVFVGTDGDGNVYLRAETFQGQGKVVRRRKVYNLSLCDVTNWVHIPKQTSRYI